MRSNTVHYDWRMRSYTVLNTLQMFSANFGIQKTNKAKNSKRVPATDCLLVTNHKKTPSHTRH
jgi:hypothetical protein